MFQGPLQLCSHLLGTLKMPGKVAQARTLENERPCGQSGSVDTWHQPPDLQMGLSGHPDPVMPDCSNMCDSIGFLLLYNNHHNLSSLNNTCLSSHNSLYPMWAQQANIKLSAGLCSFTEALEENLFLCSFRWLLQSLVVVGLKFLSPCWLLVRAVPAFLDSWPPSSRFKVSSDGQMSFIFKFLMSLFP